MYLPYSIKHQKRYIERRLNRRLSVPSFQSISSERALGTVMSPFSPKWGFELWIKRAASPSTATSGLLYVFMLFTSFHRNSGPRIKVPAACLPRKSWYSGFRVTSVSWGS